MSFPLSRRSFLASTSALGAASALGLGPAAAQAPSNVKFMMDWAWQGPQSFALLARDRGYFREAGVNIQLDRGFGSGRVPVELAAGTYQMGYADINPAIKFMAEQPQAGIVCVAVMYDGGAQVVVVDANGPIKTPKDLEGKTLAAPEVDGARQLFPAFAKQTGIDASKINWMSVTPELREPMLAQGRAHGITGFITSSVPSLQRIGMGPERLRIFKYREFGLPFASSSILTTRRFVEENPRAVAGVVQAFMRGMQDTLKDQEAAINALKAHEPLTDVPTERGRLKMAMDELVMTDHVKKNGLSSIDPVRFQSAITMIEEAFKLPPKLKVADVYNPAFLPGAAMRAVS
jgi:NitT/TauT family transport system substrate-binding protein